MFEPNQRGNRIGRPGSQASLHGKVLFNVDIDFGGDAERFQAESNHLPSGIAAVARDARVIRRETQPGGRCAPGVDRQNVVHLQRLVDG